MSSSAAGPPRRAAGSCYRQQKYWLRYQEFFPGALRTGEDDAPEEQWWSWRGTRVHLDRITRPHAPMTVIALHGVGGYGRMLAPYGRLPALADAEYLAPDLPGSGCTGRPAGLTYRVWVDCALELVRRERARDGRPVVLLGMSTGGRLAYDVAALAGPDVRAVVTTCLVDPRRSEVRRLLAARPEQVPWSGLLGLLPRSVRVPVHWMMNIAAISNHSQFANLVWADPLGGGGGITPGFARSCVAAAPAVPPESFPSTPLLLAHPAEDRWTPTALSRDFFDRLPEGARYTALAGAGHLPVEESGLADMDRALRDFFEENHLV